MSQFDSIGGDLYALGYEHVEQPQPRQPEAEGAAQAAQSQLYEAPENPLAGPAGVVVRNERHRQIAEYERALTAAVEAVRVQYLSSFRSLWDLGDAILDLRAVVESARKTNDGEIASILNGRGIRLSVARVGQLANTAKVFPKELREKYLEQIAGLDFKAFEVARLANQNAMIPRSPEQLIQLVIAKKQSGAVQRAVSDADPLITVIANREEDPADARKAEYRVGCRIGFTEKGNGRPGTRTAILLACVKLREVADRYFSSARDIEDCRSDLRFVPTEFRLPMLRQLQRHALHARGKAVDPIDREQAANLVRDLNAAIEEVGGEQARAAAPETPEPLEWEAPTEEAEVHGEVGDNL